MPKIHVTFKDKNSEYTIDAEGWFFGAVSFSNNPRSQLKKWVKEYVIPNEQEKQP